MGFAARGKVLASAALLCACGRIGYDALVGGTDGNAVADAGGDGASDAGASGPDATPVADAGGGPSDAAAVVDAGGPAADAGVTVERQLALGFSHTCTILSRGAVRCWGTGAEGRLGYGNTATIGDDETPASAGDVPLGGTAVAIAAGGVHTCAILSGGALRCWGSGRMVELGYGNAANIGDDETPASAGDVPLGAAAVAVAAGAAHTCALLAGGAVRCWGAGGYGQLGYGNTATIGDDETPASAGDVPLGGTAVAVAAGWYHTCALLAGGGVRCWGRGNEGMLGYGNGANIGDNETPASAGDVPLGGAAVAVSAAGYQTCALLADGALRCWGFGMGGMLGYGATANIGDNETPASAGDVPLGGSAAQAAAGSYHTCALLSGGAVRCWGTSFYGELGRASMDNIGDDETPASVGEMMLGASAMRLAAGYNHTCALLAGGAVRCWGRGLDGMLGYGNTANIGDDELPASAGDVVVE